MSLLAARMNFFFLGRDLPLLKQKGALMSPLTEKKEVRAPGRNGRG